MTSATIAAHVDHGRWWRAVTAGAIARRRRIVPTRLRRVAASRVQHRAVTVDVAARRAVERRRSAAICWVEGLRGARTEHHGHRTGDRDPVVEDVTVVVPLRRRDVTLGARD